jgi:protein tyrosine phosphatase
MTLDDIIITLKSEEEILPKAVVMREFEIHHEDSTKTIMQLQVLCWPDHDIPDKNVGYSMLEIVISYIDEFRSKNSEGPVVVHCRLFLVFIL